MRQSSVTYARSRNRQRSCHLAVMLTALLFMATENVGQAYFVGNVDPIGPDNSTTNTVGATRAAVLNGSQNVGQPGVVFPQNGHELLQELRVIVWSLPVPAPDHVDFSQYNYKLKLWRSVDYFAGALPATTLSIPHPYNVTYMTHPGSGWVTPDTVFGSCSLGQPSYDLRFDLSAVSHFATPLASGDWVMTLQSLHSQVSWGQLRVCTCFGPSVQGLLSVYSQDGPPALPQGYTYNPIDSAFLAMSLTAESTVAGDFNGDLKVDAADYVVWRDGLGTKYNQDDYTLWRGNFGTAIGDGAGGGEQVGVPEPSMLVVAVAGGFGLNFRRWSKRPFRPENA